MPYDAAPWPREPAPEPEYDPATDMAAVLGLRRAKTPWPTRLRPPADAEG